jgi:hypothetical protein
MNSCNLISYCIAEINWWWFIAAFVVAFAIGAVWYSFLFTKAWIRVFKVEMGEVTAGSMFRTFSLQIVATLLFGLVFFVLTKISVWLAVLALIGFSAWEKGTMNFEFSRMKNFIMAVVIRVGYTFIAGLVFILFALI